MITQLKLTIEIFEFGHIAFFSNFSTMIIFRSNQPALFENHFLMVSGPSSYETFQVTPIVQYNLK